MNALLAIVIKKYNDNTLSLSSTEYGFYNRIIGDQDMLDFLESKQAGIIWRSLIQVRQFLIG